MQISGVNEENMMGRRVPPCWWIVRSAMSTKVFSSVATGATPASLASWRRGYSCSGVSKKRFLILDFGDLVRRTNLYVEPDVFRHLQEKLLERGEGVLDEVAAGVRLEALQLVVGRVFHPVPDLDCARLKVAANRAGTPTLYAGVLFGMDRPQDRQRVSMGGLDVTGVHELVQRYVLERDVCARLAQREVVEDHRLVVFRHLVVELHERRAELNRRQKRLHRVFADLQVVVPLQIHT